MAEQKNPTYPTFKIHILYYGSHLLLSIGKYGKIQIFFYKKINIYVECTLYIITATTKFVTS